MIEILPADVLYESSISFADLLTDGHDGYVNKHLRNPPDTFAEDYVPINLSWADRNPYVALRVLGIDGTKMKEASAYECIYLEQTFYSVVPYLLLTKNVHQYACFDKHYMKDMFVDAEWMRKIRQDKLCSVGFTMTGPGYTSFFMPHDGSGSRKTAYVKLSNGDILLVTVWHWYNK